VIHLYGVNRLSGNYRVILEMNERLKLGSRKLVANVRTWVVGASHRGSVDDVSDSALANRSGGWSASSNRQDGSTSQSCRHRRDRQADRPHHAPGSTLVATFGGLPDGQQVDASLSWYTSRSVEHLPVRSLRRNRPTSRMSRPMPPHLRLGSDRAGWRRQGQIRGRASVISVVR
jgi:hypothetical protein